MGIQGLLPALKSIITPVHVRSYAGKKAAIDTYAWLHRAAYSCSRELCEGRPTDKLIEYCLYRINLLRHHGVQPVMVFDGGVLPMKADQEEKRARSRKNHLEQAQDLERLGNRSAANDCYQKAVDITPAMASRLIKVLKEEGVQYVVAPYEADAQMAYLAIHGHVDVIITEDSDLIAYGCPRILFKMDKFGQGEEFQYVHLGRNRGVNFANFTKQMVLEMCVMTGCDYLPSLPGMGIKKAHGLILRFKTYKKVIRHLRFSGTTVSAQYEELFERALLTFHHQRVYDPVSQRMVHLNDVPDEVLVDLDFVGPDLPQELVKGIALGEIDPTTNLPFEEAFTAAGPVLPNHSYTSYQFVTKEPMETPAQKNVVTNYFFSELVKAKQLKAPSKVFCAENQRENRSRNYTIGDAPETGDIASTPEAEIFGTPLPADDEEEGLPAVKEAQRKVPDLELQEKSRRRTGVSQDPISSSVSHRIPFEPATATGLCATFSGKDRKKTLFDAPPVKRSGYFSPSQPMRSVTSEAPDGDNRKVIESELKDFDSCGIEVTKKSRISSRDVVFENREEACTSGPGSQSPGGFDKFIHTTKRSVGRPFSSIENRNPLSSSAMVPRESGTSEVGKFCTNVSHVAQFANIAQRSVDKFAETIESYRWSSRGGARASGLRAPMAPISTNSTRNRQLKESIQDNWIGLTHEEGYSFGDLVVSYHEINYHVDVKIRVGPRILTPENVNNLTNDFISRFFMRILTHNWLVI